MEMIDSILDVLLRPFVAWWILAGLIGQVIKTQVFTRDRAKEHWAWKWARKTLPLHPAIAGVVIGLLWSGEIEPGYAGGAISGVLYFGVSGALSVWSFEVLKGLLKKYQGIELGALPGQSSPPPEPTEKHPEELPPSERDTQRMGKRKKE